MDFFLIIWGIVFFGLLGLFIGTIVKNIAEWGKNNNSPVMSVPAVAVVKRMSHSKNSCSYYITFQYESGDRSELHVSGKQYGLIAEQDFGKLTFQGTRFISFDRM